MKLLMLELMRNIYYTARFSILRKSSMAFVFGCPGHTNMGDQAMVLSIQKFFKKNFPQYGVICLTGHHYNAFVKCLLRCFLRKHDIVAATGGNHIGDRYKELDIYTSLSSIITPPKSLYFSPDSLL